MNKRHKFFTIMVVGDNPDELMSKYAIDLTVPKYIKYHYLDAEKMKANAIKIITYTTSRFGWKKNGIWMEGSREKP